MANDLYTVGLTRLDGTPTTLEPYKGRVLLIVNVASKCGLTKQYAALESLYKKYKAKGLVIVGVPANDFAGQEPGTNEEIATFCSTQYDVTFPLLGKISVVGPQKHPLYNSLIAARPTSTGVGKQKFIEGLVKFGVQPNREPELLWNFEKFIVSRHGDVVARFSPDTTPDDPDFVKVIETELART